MNPALIFFFSLLSLPLFSATIRGKVIDAATGEELVGATIYLKDLKNGVSVGFEGSYAIKNVSTGNHVLVCNFIGYQPYEINISVSSENEELTFDFKMKSLSSQLDEITVTTEKDLSTESSVRESEKQSGTIINAVSAKAIEMSPDLNIANVVQRMSGVTLDKSGGNGQTYALLRGMDKRYNYTLVNGIKIPSTNSKNRYVPLDIFPSDLVDRIEVTKAVTPDMEGDAIGGAVNLVMKNAPDRFLVMANASIGHSQYLFEQGMNSFDTKGINFESPYELHGKNYVATQKDFTTNNMDLKQKAFPINSFAGLTVGNRFLKRKLGVLVSGSFQNVNRLTNSLLFSNETKGATNMTWLTGMNQRMFYEEQRNYGVHAKLDYRFNQRHQLKLYVAGMNFNIAQVREVDKTALDRSYDPTAGTYATQHSTRTRLTVQNLLNITLQGEHQLTKAFSINWSGVYSQAANQSPDEVVVTYNTNTTNGVAQPQGIATDGTDNYRIWRHNTDDDIAGYLNLKYVVKAGITKMEFSAGSMYRMKTRTSFQNQYGLRAYSTTNPLSIKDIGWHKYSQIQWSDITLNNQGPENFDASENVLAYYGMAKFNIQKLQAIGGVRVENTEQGYEMLYTQKVLPKSKTYNYVNVLPSLHLKYELNEKNNLRAAYYKATNRPGFQEVVPFETYGDDYNTAGNDSLKIATADNLDLRWEFYPSKLDQIMLGAFYKDIKDPIEYAFEPYKGNKQDMAYMPINAPKAVNYGLEFDFTKFFNHWGIKVNYTLTRSSITTNKQSRVTGPRGDSIAYVAQTRPLVGQAAHLANLSLLYQSQHNGLSGQLAFSYTGDRLYAVSQYLDNDLWQKGFFQLDFSAEKRFEKGLSVFVKAQNLLNTHVIVYIKGNNPSNDALPFHNSSDKNTLVRDDYSKATYLMGVRYKF